MISELSVAFGQEDFLQFFPGSLILRFCLEGDSLMTMFAFLPVPFAKTQAAN